MLSKLFSSGRKRTSIWTSAFSSSHYDSSHFDLSQTGSSFQFWRQCDSSLLSGSIAMTILYNFFLHSIHDPVALHQLDTLLCQLDGAGGAAVCAGLLLACVVCNALHPRNRQQVRALFEVRVARFQIRFFGKNRA